MNFKHPFLDCDRSIECRVVSNSYDQPLYYLYSDSLIPYLVIADTCSDLPDVFNLVTSAIFPVNYGVRVRISCISGYSLAGDDHITCIKDREFQFVEMPNCVLGL